MSDHVLTPPPPPELQEPLPLPAGPPAESQLMLLPDGRIFAHHLTPGLAELLSSLVKPE